jgi:hypothetical protein
MAAEIGGGNVIRRLCAGGQGLEDVDRGGDAGAWGQFSRRD